MSEVTVTSTGDPEAGLEDEAAHEAAVHQGAAEVHAEQAEDAAAQAEAAAVVAAQSIQATVEAADVAAQAADQASASAVTADANARLIADALTAQSAALQSLVEELRANKKPARPAEPVSKSPDKPPSTARGTRLRFRDRYYGGR